MVKKKTSLQNIIIIILSILLLISIVVGITYSIQNNKKTVIKGEIYTANLSIELGSDDQASQSSSLWISGTVNENLVPGDKLPNIRLNVTNSSPIPVYIAILFTLNKGTEQITDVPAVNFLSYNEDDFQAIVYEADADTKYACLITHTQFDTSHPRHNQPVEIVGERALQIPYEWGNSLKGAEVTISLAAYAIQASLEPKYENAITNSADRISRSQAIAKAIFEITGIDKTVD